MWLRKILRVLSVFGCAVLLPVIAHAAEFYVGEPIVQDNLRIVPNYLTGIKMDQMPKAMDMSPYAIHIEADVHATKGEKHGFAEDAWIPYLTINFTITKQGSSLKKTGTLAAMTAAFDIDSGLPMARTSSRQSCTGTPPTIPNLVSIWRRAQSCGASTPVRCGNRWHWDLDF